MKCSEQVKLAGLKSKNQFSEITGVAGSTLSDWHRDKPRLFELLLLGTVEYLKGEQNG